MVCEEEQRYLFVYYRSCTWTWTVRYCNRYTYYLYIVLWWLSSMILQLYREQHHVRVEVLVSLNFGVLFLDVKSTFIQPQKMYWRIPSLLQIRRRQLDMLESTKIGASRDYEKHQRALTLLPCSSSMCMQPPEQVKKVFKGREQLQADVKYTTDPGKANIFAGMIVSNIFCLLALAILGTSVQSNACRLIRVILFSYGILWGFTIIPLSKRVSDHKSSLPIGSPLFVSALISAAASLAIMSHSTRDDTLKTLFIRTFVILMVLLVLWASSLGTAMERYGALRQTWAILCSMMSKVLASALLPSLIVKPTGKKHKRIYFLVLFCVISWAACSYTSDDKYKGKGIRGVKIADGTFIAQLRGSPNTGYCVLMQIGTPGNQEFCMLVDTGSANLAVAGREDSDINERFTPELSATYNDLHKTAHVTYTSGSWQGGLARDVISIDDSLAVEAYFVVITKASGFYIKEAEWVGILGMAYKQLAKPGNWVETFWDSYRTIYSLRNVFSLQLCPPLDIPILPEESSTVPQDGWMVLGGINQTYYHKDRGIYYTSIVREEFYNVLITNMSVGESEIDLPCIEFNTDQTIVDSGTTDIYLPKPVFEAVTNAFIAHFADGIPLEVPDSFWIGAKKLAWPVDDLNTIYRAFPTVNISFAMEENSSMEFTLVVTPQLYLRQVKGSDDEQVATNCFPDCDYFTFGIRQRDHGTVLGSNMMLGFYTIFDQEQKRIGFAESTCKYQDMSKDSLPRIMGPYHRVSRDCACHNCLSEMAYWEVASYVCGGIAIPLAIFSIFLTCSNRCCQLIRAIKSGCGKCFQRCKKYSTPVMEEGESVRIENSPLIMETESDGLDRQSVESVFSGSESTQKECTVLVQEDAMLMTNVAEGDPVSVSVMNHECSNEYFQPLHGARPTEMEVITDGTSKQKTLRSTIVGLCERQDSAFSETEDIPQAQHLRPSTITEQCAAEDGGYVSPCSSLNSNTLSLYSKQSSTGSVN